MELVSVYPTIVRYRGCDTVKRLYEEAGYPPEIEPSRLDQQLENVLMGPRLGARDYWRRYSSDEKFPQDPPDRTGDDKIDICLHHPGAAITPKEAREQIENNKWRGVTVAELYAFGGQYPDEQTRYPILCLGQPRVQPLGMWLAVAIFVVNGVRRPAFVDWDGAILEETCRFAIVKK